MPLTLESNQFTQARERYPPKCVEYCRSTKVWWIPWNYAFLTVTIFVGNLSNYFPTQSFRNMSIPCSYFRTETGKKCEKYKYDYKQNIEKYISGVCLFALHRNVFIWAMQNEVNVLQKCIKNSTSKTLRTAHI